MRPPQQFGLRSLALLDRRPAQVLAVASRSKAQSSAAVVAEGPHQLEVREPAVIADDHFAVDQAGAGRKRHDRRHHQ